jgi:hypothetical protein
MLVWVWSGYTDVEGTVQAETAQALFVLQHSICSSTLAAGGVDPLLGTNTITVVCRTAALSRQGSRTPQVGRVILIAHMK